MSVPCQTIHPCFRYGPQLRALNVTTDDPR